MCKGITLERELHVNDPEIAKMRFGDSNDDMSCNLVEFSCRLI